MNLQSFTNSYHEFGNWYLLGISLHSIEKADFIYISENKDMKLG